MTNSTLINRRNLGLLLGMIMAVGLTAGALITSTGQGEPSYLAGQSEQGGSQGQAPSSSQIKE